MDGIESDELVEQETGSVAPQTDPVDLSEAFKMARKDYREPAPSSVEDDGSAGGLGDQQPESSEVEGNREPEANAAPEQQSTPQPQQQGGNEDAGGSAAGSQSFDYEAVRERMMQNIAQQARNEITEMFRKNGIKNWSVADLYKKDENSGRVTFNNPDDPDRPFQSRAEAEQWVTSMNNQVQQGYQEAVRRRGGELLNQQAPTIRLAQFAPVYYQMNDMQKAILNDIIEPYEIKQGDNVIGYNVDLMSAAQQAVKIAARYGGQQQQQQPQNNQAAPKQRQQAAAPAMDMGGTGGSSQPQQKEPKTLEEAMTMYRQMKKEKK
jgi:hypothetical protein